MISLVYFCTYILTFQKRCACILLVVKGYHAILHIYYINFVVSLVTITLQQYFPLSIDVFDLCRCVWTQMFIGMIMRYINYFHKIIYNLQTF